MKKWHSPSTLSGLWSVNKVPGHIIILVRIWFTRGSRRRGQHTFPSEY